MLILYIIIIFSLFISKDYADNIYQTAYNHIINSDEIKTVFKNKLIEKPDSISICISKEKLVFNPKLFIYDIVTYEYPNANGDEKNELYQILNKYYKDTKISDKNDSVSYTFPNDKFNIILYFSEENNNRIIADLRIYNSKYSMVFENGNFIGYKDNQNYFDASSQGDYIQFLFYMDCGTIKKVFYKIISVH